MQMTTQQETTTELTTTEITTGETTSPQGPNIANPTTFQPTSLSENITINFTNAFELNNDNSNNLLFDQMYAFEVKHEDLEM